MKLKLPVDKNKGSCGALQLMLDAIRCLASSMCVTMGGDMGCTDNNVPECSHNSVLVHLLEDHAKT